MILHAFRLNPASFPYNAVEANIHKSTIRSGGLRTAPTGYFA